MEQNNSFFSLTVIAVFVFYSKKIKEDFECKLQLDWQFLNVQF